MPIKCSECGEGFTAEEHPEYGYPDKCATCLHGMCKGLEEGHEALNKMLCLTEKELSGVYRANDMLQKRLHEALNPERPDEEPTDGGPPNEIYLQWHGDGDPDYECDVFEGEVTWCENKIFANDVLYVRDQEDNAADATGTDHVKIDIQKLISAAPEGCDILVRGTSESEDIAIEWRYLFGGRLCRHRVLAQRDGISQSLLDAARSAMQEDVNVLRNGGHQLLECQKCGNRMTLIGEMADALRIGAVEKPCACGGIYEVKIVPSDETKETDA